jgi:signal transduction histidine kinase
MGAGGWYGRRQGASGGDGEDLLRRAAAALTKTGEDFLPAVVEEIARFLDAPLVFVGELTGDEGLQTVAVSREGRLAENVACTLRDSPVRELASGAEFCHADGVRERFPRDGMLASVDARGCVGMLLTDTRHAPIGAIVAATASPIEDPERARSILTLFAGRVSAEMQRTRTERELRAREEHLLQVQRVDAVGRLAGGIAHDFNNLLMVIIGYAEILRDRVGAAGEITELLAAANRAARLTRQLLAFGRRQVLQTERVDLNRVVSQVQALLVPLLGAHVRLETTLERDLPAVEADPAQFEQVLVNLALNARDAMPDGGTLILRTRTERRQYAYYQMPPGRYVCLSVSDTGVGMTPDVQAHIFEPFYTTKGNGGSGLGLSSVYGIVKQSGGFIWCSSEPGHGTTFTIYLHPAKGAAAAVSESNPAAAAGERGSERVLVVDDEPGVRRLMARLLRVRGYAVADSEDASAALAYLESLDQPVDLVVTDIVMPGMSGIRLAEEIEARWPRVKVLLVTGYAESEALRSNRPQSRPLLPKPFTPSAMAAAVRDVLEGRIPPAPLGGN